MTPTKATDPRAVGEEAKWLASLYFSALTDDFVSLCSLIDRLVAMAEAAQPPVAPQPATERCFDPVAGAEELEALCAAQPPAQPVGERGLSFDVAYVTPELHPKTRNLVARFAMALAEKLLAAQEKYGYSDGWARDDWMDECRQHLREHIEKGDPRDVAAYCAFLWHHGESTAPTPPEARAVDQPVEGGQ